MINKQKLSFRKLIPKNTKYIVIQDIELLINRL
jgi:hypothetical protein